MEGLRRVATNVVYLGRSKRNPNRDYLFWDQMHLPEARTNWSTALRGIGPEYAHFTEGDSTYEREGALNYARLYINKRVQHPTVIHELQHAVNDQNGTYWFFQDHADEGSAHAVEFVVRGLSGLRAFEDLLESPPKDDARTRLANAWSTAWNQNGLNVVGRSYKVPGDLEDYPLTEEYVGNGLRDSGIHLSCTDLARMYNNHPTAQRLCLEFVCDPDSGPSGPVPLWRSANTPDELPEVLK